MNKYTFVKKDNGGWYLVVKDLLSFTAVIEWKGNLLAYGWMDIKTETEVDENGHRWGHPVTSYGNTLQQLLEMELFKTGKQAMPLVECINFLAEKMNGAFTRLYEEDGSVLVNTAGGCMPDDDTFRTVQTVQSDEFVFPKEKGAEVRIIKWPNGDHYYAKIGSEDVVVDGKQCWKTKKAAQAATDKYFAIYTVRD